jgi:hypothetical protein
VPDKLYRPVYFAAVGWVRLIRAGWKPRILAGTMHWRVTPAHEDIGEGTHFTLEWEPDDMSVVSALLNGDVPNMYCWLVIPETGELVDFATGDIQAMCCRLTGMPWRTAAPPPYLWSNQLPPDAAYIPDRQASEFAELFIVNKVLGALRHVLGAEKRKGVV